VSRIRLTIDRIALQGFDPADRKALVAGIRSQLERVLADSRTRAALTHSRRTPVVRLGTLSFKPGPAGSRGLGTQIGSQIGSEIGSKISLKISSRIAPAVGRSSKP
jgi:hypothetical protein